MKVYGSITLDGELKNVKVEEVMPEVVQEEEQKEAEDETEEPAGS